MTVQSQAANEPVSTWTVITTTIRIASCLAVPIIWFFLIGMASKVAPIFGIAAFFAMLVVTVQHVRALRAERKSGIPLVPKLWYSLSLIKSVQKFQRWSAEVAGEQMIRKLGLVSDRDDTKYGAVFLEHPDRKVLSFIAPSPKVDLAYCIQVAQKATAWMKARDYEVHEVVPGEFQLIWWIEGKPDPLAGIRKFGEAAVQNVQTKAEAFIAQNEKPRPRTPDASANDPIRSWKAGDPLPSTGLGHVARTEDGDFTLDLLNDPWHSAIQGQTRSGKSVGTYAILARMAEEAAAGRAIIGGVDPTGLLLSPFEDYPGSEYRATGLSSMAKIASAIAAAVSEMDERITQLLALGVDKITPSEDHPALVFVLEEYPGVIAAVDSWDKMQKPADRIMPQLKNGIQRLIQEGAKCGIRVVIIAQRMDASIIGGSERSNIGNRISFRVDNRDATTMLHPHLTPEQITDVTHFPAGKALISRPAEDDRIVRFDLMDYGDFIALIRRLNPNRKEADDE